MKTILGNRKRRWKSAIWVVVSFAAANVCAQETRKVLVQTTPVYPQMARQFHLAGTVKVQVVIAPDGQIKEMNVVGGHPLLAEAALAALKKWKFAPSNAESTQVLEFNFKP